MEVLEDLAPDGAEPHGLRRRRKSLDAMPAGRLFVVWRQRELQNERVAHLRPVDIDGRLVASAERADQLARGVRFVILRDRNRPRARDLTAEAGEPDLDEVELDVDEETGAGRCH